MFSSQPQPSQLTVLHSIHGLASVCGQVHSLDVLVICVPRVPVPVVFGSASPHFIGADRQDALGSVVIWTRSWSWARSRGADTRVFVTLVWRRTL
jgi:hypothetical protein